MGYQGASFEADSEPHSRYIQDPRELFSIDDEDIEMVPARRPAVHRSAEQHSSDEARPPTSESDATGLNMSFDNDEDEEHESDRNDPLLQGILHKVLILSPRHQLTY